MISTCLLFNKFLISVLSINNCKVLHTSRKPCFIPKRKGCYDRLLIKALAYIILNRSDVKIRLKETLPRLDLVPIPVRIDIETLGTVKIQVKRGSFTCLLLCRLVDSKRCLPILGKLACEGMGVVEIKDSDAIRQPDTSGAQVVSVQNIKSSSNLLTKKQVVEMFLNVFDEGLALREGECHIRLIESVKPVQHAP